MKAHWTREAINLVVPRVLANIINPDNIDALLTSQCTVAHATVTMDIKGQRDCERLFLWIMWTATVLACLAGFIIDKVIAIFSVFGGFLVLCALICLPDWPMFNRNPLRFVVEAENTGSNSGQVKED